MLSAVTDPLDAGETAAFRMQVENLQDALAQKS